MHGLKMQLIVQIGEASGRATGTARQVGLEEAGR